MQAAIEASRKSKVDESGSVPRVGAVAVIRNEIVGTAYREEIEVGQHAEYILLEKHLHSVPLTEATIYTTLEPCTERGRTQEGKPKIPCLERLISRKVNRVVIGMLDPNPIVRGLGFRKLRLANIRTDMFPNDLMSEIEDINRNFIRAIEHNPIHQITQEIAVLSVKTRGRLQEEARDRALNECAKNMRRIFHYGQIPIPGGEAGYFKRWIESMETYDGTENVKAYIRLAPFNPTDLLTRNWFNTFYERIKQLVKCGKLTLKYVFLLRSRIPQDPEIAFLDRFKEFADEIRTVDEGGVQLQSDSLRPSIVLFQNQRFAFTHDRNDNTTLVEAIEHVSEAEFVRLSDRFRNIEMISSLYFRR